VTGHPAPPILVICTEEVYPDVVCRDTARDAERSMESYEIEDGFYTVFDSAGRMAELATVKWQVRIAGWSEPSPERLRPLLETYLTSKGASPGSGSTLAELVRSVALVAEEQEQARLRPRWLARLARARSKRHP